MLKAVIKGHARFVYYHSLGLSYAIKKYNLEDKLKILPVNFKVYNHYAVVSKKYPQEYFEMVQDALKHINNNGLFKKYL
ncbi:type 2 periplasmic-binding domain-containing protein [Piscirickettsia litoralis]|uniref:LysR substrate-binding domain-containing protein n=1 Tax=Piscirickettsia litoralis TaxID=1891921 RepID=A0ABX2ZYT7_9GAMM|nr:hypothetical protein [Piscirickettsia litoralis]ODN41779.1 hypothetical protein BGC07_00760 [Piscirickettsia litoralis]